MELREKTVSALDLHSYDPYFVQQYEALRHTEGKHALVQINIKHFRYFNTKYGAEGGDEILQLVFQRIVSTLEEGEHATYLYADNFAILLHYQDTQDLIYERLMQLIDRVYRIEDARIYRNLFISMGIFEMAGQDLSFQDALNSANLCRKESDTLLNRSCCMELNEQHFYDDYMQRMDLEAETAEAYKNFEFVTYVQPKVDLKTEQIVGAEALLRWFDKDGKNIPLNKFLPILNQNGYIKLIDIDSFTYVCKYMDERIKQHKKVVPISFNLSKSYFYDPNLFEDYKNIFEQYQIPRELIEIELMESITLDDTEGINRVACMFKEYGFTCSLDDFGNGYSTFNVLLNAPIDIVKMDRQFFVHNLNGDAELLIKTVVNLVHSLKMKVVAEGVETREYIDYLKDCGCDYVQGYYYYKPMPMEEFERLLEAQEAEQSVLVGGLSAETR